MCDKSFSKDNINGHIKDNNCKLNTTCNKCGLICESNDKLENCMKNEHNNRQVCKYYRRGHCLKGNNCLFEHIDRQNNFNNSNMKLQNKQCRNGNNCRFYYQGNCNFTHNYSGHQNNQRAYQNNQNYHFNQNRYQNNQNSFNIPNRECWYQNNCRRNWCIFKHNSSEYVHHIQNPQSFQRLPSTMGIF